jgi:hypothetical protein
MPGLIYGCTVGGIADMVVACGLLTSDPSTIEQAYALRARDHPSVAHHISGFFATATGVTFR